MIDLSGVTMQYPLPKRYRDLLLHPFRRKALTALASVSLRIPRGSGCALLGPNGAGKTTLLKLAAGLLYPASGSVRVDGFDTVTANLEVRRRVGFVMNEERSFYWRLSGRQNLRFFGTLEEIERHELEGRIDQLLALVGLVDKADRDVGGYSSGMRQRLALARGLLTDPEVLVLDEPTRAIDPMSAQELRQVLHSLQLQHSKTLVVATHQLDEAELLCEQLCVLHRGQLLSSLRREEALERHGSVAEYLRESLRSATSPVSISLEGTAAEFNITGGQA